MNKIELDLTKATEFTKEMGLHSGYPECCVDYFIQVWIYLTPLERQGRRNKISGWWYIPCEECLMKNNKIIRHRCNSECHKYFEEKYGIYRKGLSSEIRLK